MEFDQDKLSDFDLRQNTTQQDHLTDFDSVKYNEFFNYNFFAETANFKKQYSSFNREIKVKDYFPSFKK